MPLSPTKLRSAMKRRKLTQAALAAACECSQPRISQLLRAASDPGVDLVRAMAKALRVRIDALLV